VRAADQQHSDTPTNKGKLGELYDWSVVYLQREYWCGAGGVKGAGTEGMDGVSWAGTPVHLTPNSTTHADNDNVTTRLCSAIFDDTWRRNTNDETAAGVVKALELKPGLCASCGEPGVTRHCLGCRKVGRCSLNR